jgi:hypothetical protein
MKKKNTLLTKWVLGILIILLAVTYWRSQQTQNRGQGIFPTTASSVSSQNNFFQFLGHLIGIHAQGPSSGEGSNGNNVPPASGPLPQGMLPGKTASNVEALQETNPLAGQAPNPENASEINAENNSESNTEIPSGINAENNSGNNQGNNAENNSEINAQSNQEFNAEANPELNAEVPSGINAENNAENNLGNNPQTNTENAPGANAEISGGIPSENTSESNPASSSSSESGSGNNQAFVPVCVPQCFPQCTRECNTKYANLATINPIPSDTAVSQSVAQQNLQNAALDRLLTTRSALVIPVQQQAQALKYQYVDPNAIPAVSTNSAPADIVQKVKANQLSLH